MSVEKKTTELVLETPAKPSEIVLPDPTTRATIPARPSLSQTEKFERNCYVWRHMTRSLSGDFYSGEVETICIFRKSYG